MKGSIDKVCVITQPTYLPWIGYFDLADQADEFVFLDNVQFNKQSWQQRNRIKTANKTLDWITVPVLSKGKFGQIINDVEINVTDFPEKQIKSIAQNYSRSPYFECYFTELSEILRQGERDRSLCSLNTRIILWASSKLNISTRFRWASQLKLEGKRSELLVKICSELSASTYLTTLGSMQYLKEDYHLFKEKKINVYLHNYIHPEYSQLYPPFVSNACIIDLLFNEGERSMDIIRSGRDSSQNIEGFI